MLQITPTIAIDESEIQMEFIRSSGPGGQNVNKVASAVQLRFDIRHSPALPAEVRRRLISIGGQRVTKDEVLIINARRFRTQEQNRRDALERLTSLIRRAAETRKPRRKTRPSFASRQRRLDSKKRRSQTKRNRGRVRRDD